MAIITIILTIKLFKVLLIIVVAIIRRNAHHLPHSLHGIGWGGVGMLTFPRPCSLDHAEDVDATLRWGGVGWGGVGWGC